MNLLHRHRIRPGGEVRRRNKERVRHRTAEPAKLKRSCIEQITDLKACSIAHLQSVVSECEGGRGGGMELQLPPRDWPPQRLTGMSFMMDSRTSRFGQTRYGRLVELKVKWLLTNYGFGWKCTGKWRAAMAFTGVEYYLRRWSWLHAVFCEEN